ncbi:MAG: tetratricopeptide repeat protein, partial [Gammaproteobacteria bacterium]
MPSWIWFVLPLAMVVGWVIGRRGGTTRPKGDEACFDTRYFQGLNYVLNEQPDKAIEVFIKMVEVDSDTVETHFALGSLFRRRGEVDRAIRLHQNLIARPNLDRGQRAQALLELGRDYMLAGLFDRAENLFRELVDARFHIRQAYENLVAIYEQEKDWDNAIKAARNLEGRVPRDMRPVIAQFHCEKADIE